MSTVATSTRPMSTRRNSTRTSASRTIRTSLWCALSVLVFAFFAFPVYWMVNTSLQPANEVLSSTPSFFPKEATLRAYDTAFTAENPVAFPIPLSNSLQVTFLTLVVALVVGFMAALALTRFQFRSRRTMIIGILIIQMIPGEAMFVSIFQLINSWKLTNTIVGLGIVYIAAVIPFTIWTLRGFVNGVPAELEEAAMIDGCSRGRAFWKVTFPLLAPGLVATGVFAFIQAWNEFVTALVLMTDTDMITLPLWLRFFQQATRATDWSALMAGSVLMSIPVIVFFLIVQGRMTGGLVSGAVKG